MTEWSPQQDSALRDAGAWLHKSSDQVFRLFGWAGTGKSTLAKELGKQVKKVEYAAFTGKAALVMRKKGCAGASTIHSLIYHYDEFAQSAGGEPKFKLNPESAAKDADLIIVDEVSMVDAQLGMDLLSFGTKVLVLGDPFQLPPVKGSGFFTANKPDVMLTEIHRQAQGNPIIQMSMDIREGNGLRLGTYGKSRVILRKDVDKQDVLLADQVLVGTNKSRQLYNRRIRELKDRASPTIPEVGDKLVCLKNDHSKKLLNGMLFVVNEVKPEKRQGDMTLILSPEDAGRRKAPVEVKVNELFFADRQEEMTWAQRARYSEFTFGYALTCHKAQGSQWDNVYLFDESHAFRQEPDRWLYTAVTRAAEQVTVVQ